jgi:hypothetical protein
MKLRIQLEIHCSLCNKPVPGEAFVWTESGLDTSTYLNRAQPLDAKAGAISNSGGGNRFTCQTCLDTLANKPTDAP